MDSNAITLHASDAAPMTTAARADRLEALFEAHRQRLFRLAVRLGGNADVAADLVQESFARAAAAGRRLPPDDAAEAWLVRVLVNLCRDRWRRARVRALPHMGFAPPSSVPSHEASALARATVRAALASLPARRRAVIVLRELEGHSTAEVSRLLGIRQVTVRWHLRAAREQLRAVLQSGGNDERA